MLPCSSKGQWIGHDEEEDVRERLGTTSPAASQSFHDAPSEGEHSEATPPGFIRVTITKNKKQEEVLLDAGELLQLKAQQAATLQKLRRQEDLFTVPPFMELHPLLGAYLAEALGTFCWTIVVTLAKSKVNTSVFDPLDTTTNVDMLPTGLILSTLIFVFGYISGGHFNPTVTVAVFLSREIVFSTFIMYMILQCAAALGAGFVAMLVLNDSDIFVPSVTSDYISSGLFSEWIFSLAVGLVALNTRYSQQKSNFYYGMGMGMAIAAGSAAVSSISGGCFNPAIATGLQAAKCFSGDCSALQVFWIYWVGPIIGAAVAALFFSQIAQPEESSVLLLKDSNVIPAELPVSTMLQRLKEKEERERVESAVRSMHRERTLSDCNTTTEDRMHRREMSRTRREVDAAHVLPQGETTQVTHPQGIRDAEAFLSPSTLNNNRANAGSSRDRKESRSEKKINSHAQARSVSGGGSAGMRIQFSEDISPSSGEDEREQRSFPHATRDGTSDHKLV